jgi:hypothetical protein
VGRLSAQAFRLLSGVCNDVTRDWHTRTRSQLQRPCGLLGRIRTWCAVLHSLAISQRHQAYSALGLAIRSSQLRRADANKTLLSSSLCFTLARPCLLPRLVFPLAIHAPPPVIRDRSCRPNHHNRFLFPFILCTIPGLYIRSPSQHLVEPGGGVLCKAPKRVPRTRDEMGTDTHRRRAEYAMP